MRISKKLKNDFKSSAIIKKALTARFKAAQSSQTLKTAKKPVLNYPKNSIANYFKRIKLQVARI